MEKITGVKLELTIEELLNIEAYDEDILYGLSEINIFEPIQSLDTWRMDIKVEERITERKLVKDMNCDGRSRDVNILLYENVPFAIYQYRGKGYYENERIFNRDVYLKMLSDYMTEYLTKKKDIEVANVNDKYEISNYDMGFYIIEDNKITSLDRK